METVAVDDRRSVQPDLDVVDVDFGGEITDRGGDLGNRHEAARVEHSGSGQHYNGPRLATGLGQPHIPAFQGSPHASASVQKASARSGRRRYA